MSNFMDEVCPCGCEATRRMALLLTQVLKESGAQAGRIRSEEVAEQANCTPQIVFSFMLANHRLGLAKLYLDDPGATEALADDHVIILGHTEAKRLLAHRRFLAETPSGAPV